MATVLDYRNGRTERRLNAGLGRLAAKVAALSAVGIVFSAYHIRMSMVSYHGEWCGTSAMNAESMLYFLGFLLIVPAIATFISWREKAGLRISRLSLSIAVLGWLVYVGSTLIGLPY